MAPLVYLGKYDPVDGSHFNGIWDQGKFYSIAEFSGKSSFSGNRLISTNRKLFFQFSEFWLEITKFFSLTITNQNLRLLQFTSYRYRMRWHGPYRSRLHHLVFPWSRFKSSWGANCKWFYRKDFLVFLNCWKLFSHLYFKGR